MASGTVLIDLGTTSCTGTLIAPTLVLTGAHCLVTGNTPSVLFDGGGRIATVDCFVHPEAIGGTTVTSCDELAGRVEDEVVIHHDLALLELERDAPVMPRGISAPRWCLGAEPGSALAESRGMRGGPLRRQRREAIPSSYRSLGSSGTEYALCFHEDVVQRGDSGGTIVASDDPAGPVVAANSELGQGTRCNRQPLLWQHHPGPGPLGAAGLRNIDWIWSVRDPAGSCSFGSTGPCTPARLGGALPDRDGDGLPDVRDLCPEVPLTADRAAACAEQHCDVDRDWVGDACDDHDGLDNVTGLPNAEIVACDHDDPDGDGIPSLADPCPLIHAEVTDPTDRDGDGVPDVCDACPSLDNSTVDVTADEDVDSIPDPCDNCIGDPNPDQANCNVDAERTVNRLRAARGEEPLPELGDACDPIPCGETEVDNPLEGRDDPLRVAVDARVDSADGGSLGLRTTYRFCRCSAAENDTPDEREECEEDQGDLTGECTLLDIPRHDLPDEEAPWRWTTHELTPGVVETAPEALATYGPYRGTFEEDQVSGWHLFDLDIPRWIRGSLVLGETFPEAGRSSAIEPLPGVLWTHTPGPITADFNLPTRQLASHYTSQIFSRADLPPRPPYPCIQPIAPYLGSAIRCPFCPTLLPQAYIAFAGFRPRCPDLRFEALILDLPGTAVDPSPRFPLPGLARFANDPGPWVAAVESGPALSEDGFRYAKLVDGHLVTRLILSSAGELVEGQPSCPPQEKCFAVPLDVAAQQTVLGGSPAPRTGAATVLSATRGALFLTGGTGGDGETLHDLWRFDVPRARWRRLSLPAPLGRVLALTYSRVHDLVFVLDEVDDPEIRGARRRLARLVAIHPEGSVADVVASWPRVSGNDAYALAAAPDGSVWVAGSPVPGAVHTVRRLVLGAGGWTVDGWLRAGGALLEGAQARATRRGVTVVLSHAARGADVVAVRLTDLRRGRDGERACF